MRLRRTAGASRPASATTVRHPAPDTRPRARPDGGGCTGRWRIARVCPHRSPAGTRRGRPAPRHRGRHVGWLGGGGGLRQRPERGDDPAGGARREGVVAARLHLAAWRTDPRRQARELGRHRRRRYPHRGLPGPVCCRRHRPPQRTTRAAGPGLGRAGHSGFVGRAGRAGAGGIPGWAPHRRRRHQPGAGAVCPCHGRRYRDRRGHLLPEPTDDRRERAIHSRQGHADPELPDCHTREGRGRCAGRACGGSTGHVRPRLTGTGD